MKDFKKNKLSITALLVLCLAIAVVLFFSCLSFDSGDFPSRYVWPNNSPAENWCGSVGAFAAFYLMYYVGPGIFVFLTVSAAAILWKLLNRSINQIILRTAGAVLVTVCTSAMVFMLRPFPDGCMPIGSGGVLGSGINLFLKNNFSLLGSVIITVSSLIVGLILLADSLVVKAFHFAGLFFMKMFGMFAPAWYAARQQSSTLAGIWQKLSARKPEPTIAELLAQEAQTVSEDSYPAVVAEPSVNTDKHLEEHLNNSRFAEKPIATAEKKQTHTEPAAAEPVKLVYGNENFESYTLPAIDLLIEPEYNFGDIQDKIIKAKSTALEQVLTEFGISAKVVNFDSGPTITMYELELAAGVKVSQITNLSNDIARALGAGVVRVVAPLAGKHTIGIEVPNSQKETVRLKDLIVRAGNSYARMHIPLFLGKDSSGRALVSDLATMPHMLIAGTTGSGKSVCINSIIMSIMLTKKPDEVKLVLVDPKMVEMTAFAKIPHLMAPIITEVNRAEQIFEWATTKMDERYALLAEAGVKNIASYNALGTEEIIRRFDPQSPEEEARIPKKMPYFVIIVDELADLMMTSSKEVESYIVRLAQKSRAVGIHIVLATQRPQATVVTGLIKSNLPCRTSFRVASRMDSRIVLDQNGAETLLGQGDMLFLKPGTSDLVRAQGAYVDDIEVRKVVKHLTSQANPQFHPELMQLNKIDTSEACKDELFDEAVKIVLESRRGSVSLLQRKLSIGYARSSRIIEAMATSGILGEYKGSQAREVMMTLDEYERICQQRDADQRAGFSDLQEDTEQYDSPAEYITDSDEQQEDEDDYEYQQEQETEEDETQNISEVSAHQIKDANYNYAQKANQSETIQK